MLKVPDDKSGLPKSDWFEYKNVVLHKGLFQRGVIVACKTSDSPAEEEERRRVADPSHFMLTLRTFDIGVKKIKITDSLTNPLTLLNILRKKCSKVGVYRNIEEMQSEVISNSQRRDEIFLPLLVDNNRHQGELIGFYLYPWLSKNTQSLDFRGFDTFVTAGCMIGANLKGINTIDQSFALIKHDIKFLAQDKIVKIDYEKGSLSSYEEMLFSELEKLTSLIDSLSNPDNKKILYYHLPYYDYVLFGIELFLHGRITVEALNNFFIIIFEKKDEHMRKIIEICSAHKVEVIIGSPFENLFGSFNIGSCPKGKVVEAIFEIFKPFSIEAVSNPENTPQIERIEAEFVEYCLRKLVQNNFNLSHKQIWIDFLSSISREEVPKDIESLFTVSNIMMVGFASRGKKAYTTCSLLPLSEKQIQIKYQQFCRTLSSDYAPIFNLTILEAAGYSVTNSSGLIFYLADGSNFAKLIKKFGILDVAHRNVAQAALGQETTNLEQLTLRRV